MLVVGLDYVGCEPLPKPNDQKEIEDFFDEDTDPTNNSKWFFRLEIQFLICLEMC